MPLVFLIGEATDETFVQHRRLRTRADEYVHKPITPLCQTVPWCRKPESDDARERGALFTFFPGKGEWHAVCMIMTMFRRPLQLVFVLCVVGALGACGLVTSDQEDGDNDSAGDADVAPFEACSNVLGDNEESRRSICEEGCERAAGDHPDATCEPVDEGTRCVELCLERSQQTDLNCARQIAADLSWYDEGPQIGGDCYCCSSQWIVPSAENAGANCEYAVACRVQFRTNAARPDPIGPAPKEVIVTELSNGAQLEVHPEGFLVAGGTEDEGDALVVLGRGGEIRELTNLSPAYRSTVQPLLRLAGGTYMYRRGSIYRYAPSSEPELIVEGYTGVASFQLLPEGAGAFALSSQSQLPEQLDVFDGEGRLERSITLPENAWLATIGPQGDLFTASPVTEEVSYTDDFLLRRFSVTGDELEELWAREVPELGAPQGTLMNDEHSLVMTEGTRVHRISFDGEVLFSTDTGIPTVRSVIDALGAVYVGWTTRGEVEASFDDPLNPHPGCSPYGCDGAALVKVGLEGNIEWEYQRRDETSEVADLALVPEPALLIVSHEEVDTVKILLFEP